MADRVGTLVQVFVQSCLCMWVFIGGGPCHEEVYAVVDDAVIIHKYPFRIKKSVIVLVV